MGRVNSDESSSENSAEGALALAGPGGENSADGDFSRAGAAAAALGAAPNRSVKPLLGRLSSSGRLLVKGFAVGGGLNTLVTSCGLWLSTAAASFVAASDPNMRVKAPLNGDGAPVPVDSEGVVGLALSGTGVKMFTLPNWAVNALGNLGFWPASEGVGGLGSALSTGPMKAFVNDPGAFGWFSSARGAKNFSSLGF